MTYTLTPKAGDKVRVRHHKYGAFDALCDFTDSDETKFVLLNGKHCIAHKYKPRAPKRSRDEICDRVRFIYPLSLMPKPEVRE